MKPAANDPLFERVKYLERILLEWSKGGLDAVLIGEAKQIEQHSIKAAQRLDRMIDEATKAEHTVRKLADESTLGHLKEMLQPALDSLVDYGRQLKLTKRKK